MLHYWGKRTLVSKFTNHHHWSVGVMSASGWMPTCVLWADKDGIVIVKINSNHLSLGINVRKGVFSCTNFNKILVLVFFYYPHLSWKLIAACRVFLPVITCTDRIQHSHIVKKGNYVQDVIMLQTKPRAHLPLKYPRLHLKSQQWKRLQKIPVVKLVLYIWNCKQNGVRNMLNVQWQHGLWTLNQHM